MDISKLLDQLRRELAHMDAAILSLERLQARGVRHRRVSVSPTEARKAQTVPKPVQRRKARRTDPAE